MRFWRRILRGIDVWINRQLDAYEGRKVRRSGFPPHAVIYDAETSEPQPRRRSLEEKLDPSLRPSSRPQAQRPRKPRRSGKKKLLHILKILVLTGFGLLFVFIGIIFIWIGTLKTPEFTEFTERVIANSTKIYDRTGEVLLYDIHENIQRTAVPLEEMSPYIIDAIISIEDDQFYEHRGIDRRATIRAITFTTLSKLGLRDGRVQGGSTITQQVLKNTLLTSDSTIQRKMKEWFLALKLEKVLSKDEILEHYLNEAPYGGSMYGVETASQAFFGVPATDVTIAQSAYLAAIPNGPTLFSPYGNNVDLLEARKDRVLRLMLQFNYITDEEYEEALAEEVVFRPREETFAKAIHFVEYVRAYLEETYGSEMVETGGLEVVTTLNYDFQQEAERIAAERALENEELWNASNMSLVAIDPTNGEILTMVGSRGYSDPDIDGKFNVSLAQRQPGSSFKPFVYARAFEEGYTDETVLFDTQTQFTSHCTPLQPSDGDCYRPNNYDGEFLGPLTVRDALAQSRNIPAIKMLYLVGLNDAITTARALGISTLREAAFYGLTLVLGGGEVRLVDMVSAYGVLANDGIRVEHTPILEIRDREGTVLEQHQPRGQRIVEPEAARAVSAVLSDNEARTPLFGSRSFMYFGDQYDVAAKTGTTNNNRDAWLIGYTPTLAVGVWSGNNDNSPMKKGSSISGPAWRDFLNYALPRTERRRFVPPTPNSTDLKPALRGVWEGNNTIVIDSVSGNLATEFTPQETQVELVIPDAHTILHWVEKDNPQGSIPNDPTNDSQYANWEYGVQEWLLNNPTSTAPIDTELLANILERIVSGEDLPYDDVHIPENQPVVTDVEVFPEIGNANTPFTLTPAIESEFPIAEIEYYLDGLYLGKSDRAPFDFSFTPGEHEAYTSRKDTYTVTIEVVDEVFNRAEASIEITIEAA